MELGKDVAGSFDGSSHELRKEADVGGEMRKRGFGVDLFFIDVDGIAQSLKGVEADANGEEDF